MPILADPYNRRAVEVAEVLNRILDPSRVPNNLYVVLGGDGFMLKTVAQAKHVDPVFLGLNCGRVGFLLNELPEHIQDIAERIYALPAPMRVPRIQMTATRITGEVVTASALNDIYLERQTGQTAHLKLDINGATVVQRLVADGLICCTALGSTAYSFSAGGAACHPSLQVLGVTPICPHAPSLRPLLVPLAATIDIEVLAAERRPVRAVVDGNDWPDIAKVSIRDAHDPVSLTYWPDHDFTQTLVRKLLS